MTMSITNLAVCSMLTVLVIASVCRLYENRERKMHAKTHNHVVSCCGWWRDDSANFWNKSRWSKHEAEQASATLKGCTGCFDSADCTNCSRVRGCTGLHDMHNVNNIHGG